MTIKDQISQWCYAEGIKVLTLTLTLTLIAMVLHRGVQGDSVE